jgi:hypothetical protein
LRFIPLAGKAQTENPKLFMFFTSPLIASDRRLDGGLRLKTIADLVWHDVMAGNRNKLNPDFLLAGI